jgi:hypothetical protein
MEPFATFNFESGGMGINVRLAMVAMERPGKPEWKLTLPVAWVSVRGRLGE